MMSALYLTVLTLAASTQSPPVQTPTPSPSLAAKPSAFVLSTKGGILGTATIRAKQTETKGIVERLKQDLKINIEMSPLVAQHKIDLTLTQAPTLDLIQALAPVVLADIETAPGEEPVWIAIHLIGFNEKEPPRALKQTGFLVFAGIPTEDDEKPAAEPADPVDEAKRQIEKIEADGKPLLIVAVSPDGRVTLSARQQPLIAILNAVAAKANVPLDLRGQVDLAPVDVDLRDTPLIDLGVAIGRPGYRLVVRRNLLTGEQWVQGILVGTPPPASPVKP